MSSISVTHIIKGQKAVDKKRGDISVLMGLILEVYRPDKKYPGFTKEWGEIIRISDKVNGCWLVHCINAPAVSGIPKIEYVKAEDSTVNDDKLLGVFRLESSIISNKNVTIVHRGLQNLVNGFIEHFPETRDFFEFYADEAAHA
jgi:hypothetical protein